MGGNPTAKAFAHQLRSLIERQGYSVRGFGKKVDPDDPERGRRRLQRHLSGKHLPSRASRDSYADALEVERNELPLPDDDRDDSVEAMAREVRAQARGLERFASRLESMSVGA